MSGFDNGTTQGGVSAQAKQFGAILRGLGPPVPGAGVLGEVYIDAQAWQLYNKRSPDGVDPWGHYLFEVPATYRATLKFFSAYAPDNSVGVAGDYCLLWAGWSNYGMAPSVYGPKQANGWPENGEGGTLPIAVAGAGFTTPVGLNDEGAPIANSNSTQLIVVGLVDEYILPIPVSAGAGDPVTQLGLQSGPAAITVLLNPLYSATDLHNIP